MSKIQEYTPTTCNLYEDLARKLTASITNYNLPESYSTGQANPLYEDPSSFFHTKLSLSNWKSTGCIADTNYTFARLLFERSLIKRNHSIKELFSRIRNSFEEQFQKLSEHFKDLDKNEVKNKLDLSLIGLLLINPDVISMELTWEKSLFYTLKKDRYTFFIQYFLDEIESEDDEAIMTVFENDNKLPSYAGILQDVIDTLQKYFSPRRSLGLAVSLNEFSH